eukprot:1188776-Prorocentrum_minimum.AAC.5
MCVCRLKGRVFFSTEANITHEHYTQVVMTSVEPRAFGIMEAGYNRVDLYEYTHHSHAIKVGIGRGSGGGREGVRRGSELRV